MAGSVRIEMNHAGAEAILKDSAVLAELERRGRAIAAAAGGEPDFQVETQTGSRRARVIIRTATLRGMLGEAKDRRLSSALDAGRS